MFTFEQLEQATGYNQLLQVTENFKRNLISHVRRDFHIPDTVSKQMKEFSKTIYMDVLAKLSYL